MQSECQACDNGRAIISGRWILKTLNGGRTRNIVDDESGSGTDGKEDKTGKGSNFEDAVTTLARWLASEVAHVDVKRRLKIVLIQRTETHSTNMSGIIELQSILATRAAAQAVEGVGESLVGANGEPGGSCIDSGGVRDIGGTTSIAVSHCVTRRFEPESHEGKPTASPAAAAKVDHQKECTEESGTGKGWQSRFHNWVRDLNHAWMCLGRPSSTARALTTWAKLVVALPFAALPPRDEKADVSQQFLSELSISTSNAQTGTDAHCASTGINISVPPRLLVLRLIATVPGPKHEEASMGCCATISHRGLSPGRPDERPGLRRAVRNLSPTMNSKQGSTKM
ncbi:hypothetical protein C8R47DRAFT_1200030 [Mycena vitilis]|nr:hypothetical protein C8R47DRAFT_1200030 [Mycena vitilis]